MDAVEIRGLGCLLCLGSMHREAWRGCEVCAMFPALYQQREETPAHHVA